MTLRRVLRWRWWPLAVVGAAVAACVPAFRYLEDFRQPDVLFVGTPPDVVAAMLDLAAVTPADTVYDLGSGDGRVLLAAARKGATAVGIELDPALADQSRAAAEAAGLADKVSFRRGDIFKQDLRPATVVTMYLTPSLNVQLRPQLDALRPGTRIVSHMWSMKGAKAADGRRNALEGDEPGTPRVPVGDAAGGGVAGGRRARYNRGTPRRSLPMRRTRIALVVVAAALGGAPRVAAAEPVPADHAAKMTAAQKLFQDRVRPFLVSQCLDCHGGAKTKSGFSLATRDDLLKGGDRGPAVVPGNGRESPLVRFVARTDEPHMPPKQPAPAAAVELLATWIDLGAAYDKPLVDTAPAAGKKPLVVTDKDRDYWAYRPLRPPAPPAVRDGAWPRTPVDRFILAKLEAAGLAPAPDADPHVLIRRLTFDLTGLPPTPDEVEDFVREYHPATRDPSPAIERVVDRLLASPSYGERWGRHWLDPARFAESHGFEHDYPRPFAYHYRDFVVRALNADMPYDRFARWQIAGDELAPGDPQALAATGFLGAGVHPTQITITEAERVRYDGLDDMLATTGHTFLALTVGCARCHDHKYDPIPVRDYYRMLAAFTTTVRCEVAADLGTPAEQAAMRAWEADRKPPADELKRYEAAELPGRVTAWARGGGKPPPGADPKLRAALRAVRAWPAGARLLQPPFLAAVVAWFGPQDDGWKTRAAAVAAVDRRKPRDTRTTIQATAEGHKPLRLHTNTGEVPDFYPETYVLKRGDPGQKDGVAAPGVLQVLSRHQDGAGHWRRDRPAGATTSYRRAALADWLVDVGRRGRGPGRPGHGQPAVAPPLRPGLGEHPQRLRPAGRPADPPGVARLAGQRPRWPRLDPQAGPQAAGDEPGLRPVRGREPTRPGQQVVGAPAPPAVGGGKRSATTSWRWPGCWTGRCTARGRSTPGCGGGACTSRSTGASSSRCSRCSTGRTPSLAPAPGRRPRSPRRPCCS